MASGCLVAGSKFVRRYRIPAVFSWRVSGLCTAAMSTSIQRVFHQALKSPPAKEKWPGHRLRNPNHSPSGSPDYFFLLSTSSITAAAACSARATILAGVMIHHLLSTVEGCTVTGKNSPASRRKRRKARFQWIIPRFLVKIGRGDHFLRLATPSPKIQPFRGMIP
jgi:hypothetical protein